jgi:hypothetical protein
LGNVLTNWSIIHIGDFNGDGKRDVLGQYTSGDVSIWLINGTQVLSAEGFSAGPGATYGDLVHERHALSSASLGNVSTTWFNRPRPSDEVLIYSRQNWL